MITNAVAVMNGKGGVLKSFLAAQLAGLAAHADWRVLLVEMDAQGNVGRDLGVLDRSDRGANLYRAVRDGDPLVPLDHVRPHLDFIPGGPETANAYREFATYRDGVPNLGVLDATLAQIADRYDLIVIDCPPGEQEAQLAILIAAHWLICPTRADLGSIDGLSMTLARAATVRTNYNPSLDLLGVVLTGVGKSAKRVCADTSAEIDRRAGGRIKVYDPPIRHAESAAEACRRHGLLVHELELAAHKQARNLSERHGQAWWHHLDRDQRRELRRLPDAAGLAGDYQAVVDAILTDIHVRSAVAV